VRLPFLSAGPQAYTYCVRLRSGRTAPTPGVNQGPAMTLSPEEYDFLTPPEPGCGLGRLGRYPLRRVLSHGGMAIVFESVHPDLGQALAIKTLRKSILAQLLRLGFDPKRLLDEARLTAGVKSDYVVAVHDG